MSGGFFRQVRAVEAILSGTGSPSDKYARLQPYLADPDVAREFWTRLNDPGWIEILLEAGYFQKPPEPERLAAGAVRFPNWQASKYLVRVAAAAPVQVIAVFAHLKTENQSVVGDIIDAAMRMPASEASKLVPRIIDALNELTIGLGVHECAELCDLLARHGEANAAMQLADAMFGSASGRRANGGAEREDNTRREVLKTAIPGLVAARPGDTILRICTWLDTAIDNKNYTDAESGEDSSSWWRPAIEDHEQNREREYASVVVTVLRDSLESAIGSGLLTLAAGLQILQGFKYVVFRRLSLHLVNRFAERDPGLARATILDRSLFDDHRMKHEYAMLVGARLPMLTQPELAEWYSWVERGPDMSRFAQSFADPSGREPDDEDRRRRVNYWIYERFYWVRAHLQNGRREFYERMSQEYGEPELADLNVRTTIRFGSESPMPAEQLTGLSLREVARRVAEWQPTREQQWRGVNAEGLAAAFAAYVKADAARLSRDASALQHAPAIFVRIFLREMEQAVKAGALLQLSALLELCEWVVAQPVDERTSPGDPDERFIDPDWQWTRDAIVSLLEQVCMVRSGTGLATSDEDTRVRIWTLLATLSKGRASSYIVRDSTAEDPRVHDYLDLGINSPRGRAIQAILEYARSRADAITNSDRDDLSAGFSAMPEVRDLLLWHLEPENRTVEAMAVLGSRIGLIRRIDRAWLAEHADILFNLEGIRREPVDSTGWAAWNSFLVWVRPHVEFYRLFREQFRIAVAQAIEIREVPERSRMQPLHHLGEHLMILYGRGDLGLDSDGSLLRHFVEGANPHLRRHAVGFVGRTLAGPGEVPQDVVDRFEALWDTYWSGPGRRDAAEKPDAFLFGQWFATGRFEMSWALPRLLEFASVVGIPEPDLGVLEKLVTAAGTDLKMTLEVLRCMIEGDNAGWHAAGWKDAASTLLEAGLAAGGEAHDLAESLIDTLGRRGFMGFGRLLKL